jgi:hypothetical protein
MPTIEVDFETFKAITARRASEQTSEGDVVREALGLDKPMAAAGEPIWVSERVRFPVGAKLRHVFRNGKIAEAEIVANGVAIGEMLFPGLSPAAAFRAGHQANGWHFWDVLQPSGEWIKADTLRQRRNA